MQCGRYGIGVGGGKFKNGAITGAFSRLFNDELHRAQQRVKAQAEQAYNFVQEQAKLAYGFVTEEGVGVLSRSLTVVGGGGQVLLGGALCTTAVGCAGGGVLAVYGASNIQEGLSGQNGFMRSTYQAGFGKSAGNLIYDAINLGTAIGGLLRPVLSPSATPLFRTMPSDYAPAYQAVTKTGLTLEGFTAGNDLRNIYKGGQ